MFHPPRHASRHARVRALNTIVLKLFDSLDLTISSALQQYTRPVHSCRVPSRTSKLTLPQHVFVLDTRISKNWSAANHGYSQPGMTRTALTPLEAIATLCVSLSLFFIFLPHMRHATVQCKRVHTAEQNCKNCQTRLKAATQIESTLAYGHVSHWRCPAEPIPVATRCPASHCRS